MRISHKKFNAHKFLDKFQDHEDILQAYVSLFAGRIMLNPDDLSIDSFKGYLASDSHDSGHEEFLEELYRVHDMSSGRTEQQERCHEELVGACKQMKPVYQPDAEGNLPIECLAMKIRSENIDAFDIAYNMHLYHHVDGFSEYKGEAGVDIQDCNLAAAEFQATLESVFAEDKNSDRVKVSHYRENGSVNFVVYHEKRTIAELVFDGRKNLITHVLRPLQQDFIGYHSLSGKLKIRARFKKETNLIRRAFAEACLDDPGFFDKDGAANRIDLPALLGEGFALNTRNGDQAYLYELWGNLKQKYAPRIMLRSKNVFATLDLSRLRGKMAPDRITKAVIYIQFSGDTRPIRIELSGTNGTKIPQSRHHDVAREYLAEWGLLND